MSSNANRQPSAIRQTIAANIRAARDARGLRQREVAARLDTDVMQVSRWERGVTRPGPSYEAKLVELLFDGDLGALYAEPTEVAA